MKEFVTTIKYLQFYKGAISSRWGEIQADHHKSSGEKCPGNCSFYQGGWCKVNIIIHHQRRDICLNNHNYYYSGKISHCECAFSTEI